MAGDQRRAEVEAVARAVWNVVGDRMDSWYAPERFREAIAEAAIASLDRLRDARGDDEVVPLSAEDDERHARWEFEQSRSPQGEDHERGSHVEDQTPTPSMDGNDSSTQKEKVTQGEDHETQAVAALYEFARERWGWGSEEYEDVHDAVAVVLSCVSPSRDGTVAEIVRRLRYSDGIAPDTAVREIADWIESQYPAARDGTVAVEDVRKALLEFDDAWRAHVDMALRGGMSTHTTRQRLEATRERLLAQFSRSATGEQTDHGGDQ